MRVSKARQNDLSLLVGGHLSAVTFLGFLGTDALLIAEAVHAGMRFLTSRMAHELLRCPLGPVGRLFGLHIPYYGAPGSSGRGLGAAAVSS